MANGPRYRVPFRRRREGKTNYHRRLRLIVSGRNRLVIRCSNMHTVVQVIESRIEGDKTLVSSHSTQLTSDFGWQYATGNLPAAYLVGYLCGLRAKKSGIEDAILDVGILVHDNRVKAAFRGFLDSGITVPHDKNWFPASFSDRIQGKHIQEYALLMSKQDSKKYKQYYSKILKNKGDPTKFMIEFGKIKQEITNKV